MTDNFAGAEFYENPDARCPLLLLLDVSPAMDGAPLAALNRALAIFAKDLQRDPLTRLRVELAIVAQGTRGRLVNLQNGKSELDASRDFSGAAGFSPASLSAGGKAPQSDAVEGCIELIRQRKAIYRRNGIDFFRPILLLISSESHAGGESWSRTAEIIRSQENQKGLSFYQVLVKPPLPADAENISPLGQPIFLKDWMFDEMFEWLYLGLASLSMRRPADRINLPAAAEWRSPEPARQ